MKSYINDLLHITVLVGSSIMSITHTLKRVWNRPPPPLQLSGTLYETDPPLHLSGTLYETDPPLHLSGTLYETDPPCSWVVLFMKQTLPCIWVVLFMKQTLPCIWVVLFTTVDKESTFRCYLVYIILFPRCEFTNKKTK
jgi:hypothetical protein